MKRNEKKDDKYFRLFQLMNRWVRMKQEGKNIDEVLTYLGCKKVAIYGMGDVGWTLIEELKDTDIEVVYGIDRMQSAFSPNIKMIRPDSEMEPVDAVIVTAITYFDEIEAILRKNVNCLILSLEDMIYEL